MADVPQIVHRFEGSLFPVNAYFIESETEVVAVDATLGVSDARRLRARIDETGKPLAGVIVTHAHPDHYGGVAPLLGHSTDTPVYAVAGVDDAIRRDDAEKEAILRPMFGDEWAPARTFPTRRVQDGERVTIGTVAFRVVDVGPAESPHDSWWMLESGGPARVFPGDLVYNQMHAYLADGFSDQWLAALARAKRELPADAELFIGHGAPARGHAILDRQKRYVEEFVDAVRAADAEGVRGDALTEVVARRMRLHLPSEDLEFLMRLSVEPTRVRLASLRGTEGRA